MVGISFLPFGSRAPTRTHGHNSSSFLRRRISILLLRRRCCRRRCCRPRSSLRLAPFSFSQSDPDLRTRLSNISSRSFKPRTAPRRVVVVVVSARHIPFYSPFSSPSLKKARKSLSPTNKSLDSNSSFSLVRRFLCLVLSDACSVGSTRTPMSIPPESCMYHSQGVCLSHSCARFLWQRSLLGVPSVPLPSASLSPFPEPHSAHLVELCVLSPLCPHRHRPSSKWSRFVFSSISFDNDDKGRQAGRQRDRQTDTYHTVAHADRHGKRRDKAQIT